MSYAHPGSRTSPLSRGSGGRGNPRRHRLGRPEKPRQEELQIDAHDGDESALGLRRLDGETVVQVRNELALQIDIGLVVVCAPGHARFLRQAALDGAAGPLRAAANFRGEE